MHWKELGMKPLEKLPTFRDKFILILEISNTFKMYFYSQLSHCAFMVL